MLNHLIRPCIAADLPELMVLCQHHAEYERAEFDRTGKEEALNAALFTEEPKLYCWVVEIDKRLVGYVSYTFDFSTWSAAPFLYMDCLYLEEPYRSQGIGTRIFEILKQEAAMHNCTCIQWQTPTFNTRAISFYNRMGGSLKEKSRFTLPL